MTAIVYELIEINCDVVRGTIMAIVYKLIEIYYTVIKGNNNGYCLQIDRNNKLRGPL